MQLFYLHFKIKTHHILLRMQYKCSSFSNISSLSKFIRWNLCVIFLIRFIIPIVPLKCMEMIWISNENSSLLIVAIIFANRQNFSTWYPKVVLKRWYCLWQFMVLTFFETKTGSKVTMNGFHMVKIEWYWSGQYFLSTRRRYVPHKQQNYCSFKRNYLSI